MTEAHWKKVSADKAEDILGPDVLDDGALALLEPGMRPEAFIQKLDQAEKWPEAIKVLARALPAREAVWWACVCARKMDSLTDEADIKAIEVAEQWVYKPTEENRQEAFRVMQEGGSDSAGSFCASAAVLSAGNLPINKDQHIDLEDHIFPSVIDSVVLVAAAERSGPELFERLQLFLRSGEDIAQGGNGMVESPGESR